MSVQDKLKKSGPRKLLALDGGGIRGMMTVEVLGRMEEMLRESSGQGPDFVLADYFDYIAGTSTGAIIAAALSLGMRVDELRKFYIESGPEMFDKAKVLERFRFKFRDDKLAAKLKLAYGEETRLGSDK